MEAVLSGQVALVTGGAKRVGAAICRALHGAGAQVMIHHLASRAEAQALAAELDRQRPGSADSVQGDLLQAETPARLMEAVLARFGRLDILVNNASSFFPTAVGEITEAAWLDLIGTNLKAPLFLSQLAVPELRSRRGSIVNITDIHAERPMRGYVVYSIAKAGLAALTRSLALELGPEIRVNAVAPGPVLWPEDSHWSAEIRRRILEQVPLRRQGEPEDIARAVLYLVAHAPYVTGQTLVVDGGRSVSL
ncbi:MAG: pteridine reductase [Azospira oryzae]|nr:MAG: pteridine reductase [Azospira oryzae]PZP78202.1 MAG: pteridine reductase [Azospira oryzae]